MWPDDIYEYLGITSTLAQIYKHMFLIFLKSNK